MKEPQTTYRITAMPEYPRLDLLLTIDTTAEPMLKRLEAALGYMDFRFARQGGEEKA